MNSWQFVEWQRLHRFSNSDLAATLGVHVITVSRWRSGAVKIPKVVELALKAIEFGCS